VTAVTATSKVRIFRNMEW